MLYHTSATNRGFSLIELLIVISVISVLMAISLPQFVVYRQRAFNAAALSDLNNLQKSEGSMASDWSEFGLSTNTGGLVAGHGNGLILTGPGASTDGVAGTRFFLEISLSSNVSMVANTDAATGMSFTILSKHFNGMRIYGADSDVSGTYFQISATGLSLAGSGINIPSVSNNFDFAGWSLL